WSGKRMHLGALVNAARLRPLVKEADLIHALAEPLATTAWLASRLFGRPYLISALGTYAVEPFILGRWKWLARRVYARAAAVLCISSYTRSRLLEVCPLAPAEAVPIGHTRPAVSPVLDQNPDRPYFLTVGPLKTRKGQIHVLEAFKLLADKFPQVDWVIAGYSYNQDYPLWFKDQVARAGLSQRVHILGTVDEAVLQGLYSGCLFNVLTPVSDDHAFEGFGLTYLEAGFHGRPSIGSTDCGAGESISHGQEGFLVPPGEIEPLARAMDQLLADEDLRQKMGQAAARRARRMTWSATGRQLAAIYQEVVKSHGR
ncbi:MAG: glycosyltransferase family 4 protein, partial [Deltaproteobacteria bacterium]|nr:glycosyltransferase family 4 protein [Deltaproteobacteria bacterium]